DAGKFTEVTVDQSQESLQPGRHIVEAWHESGLRRLGKPFYQRPLTAEMVGDDTAAVAGALPDSRQRQRANTLLDDQFGGGRQQCGFGLVSAFLLGAAGGGHARSLAKKLACYPTSMCKVDGVASTDSRRFMMIEIDERELDALLVDDPGGPVVMLNLLRFRPDGGRESYQRYAEALGQSIYARYGLS